MFRIFTIALLIIPLCLNGQSRKVVVIVDTISSADSEVETYKFNIIADHVDRFRDVKTLDEPIKSCCKYPNYQRDIILIDDSSTIKIFIDTKGSYLEITKLYKLPIDTLRISNIKFYDNLTRSTSKCEISWYRIPSDGEKIKVTKHSEYSYVTKPKLNLTIYSIRINEKFYTIELKEENFGQVNISHGYKPRHYKNKRDEYKKRARKFYNKCNSTIYNKKGQIEL